MGTDCDRPHAVWTRSVAVGRQSGWTGYDSRRMTLGLRRGGRQGEGSRYPGVRTRDLTQREGERGQEQRRKCLESQRWRSCLSSAGEGGGCGGK